MLLLQINCENTLFCQVLNWANSTKTYFFQNSLADPTPVTDINVDNIGPTTATVSWSDDENCDLYIIKILCLCDGGSSQRTKGMVYPNSGPLEFVDTGLRPYCSYYYVICKITNELVFTTPSGSVVTFPEQSTATESSTFITSRFTRVQ